MSQEYVVDFGPDMKRWNLTEKDIKRAKVMHGIEKDSVGVNYPATEFDFLNTLTYSVLSSNQDTKKLRNQIFYPLRKRDLIDIEVYREEKNKEPVKETFKAAKFPGTTEELKAPDPIKKEYKILNLSGDIIVMETETKPFVRKYKTTFSEDAEHFQDLESFWEGDNSKYVDHILEDTPISRILRRARYGNSKKGYIFGFVDWWEKEKSQELIYDILDTVNDNFSLVGVRNRLADKKTGPRGIAEKTGSFAIQLLAKNIENVDIVTVDMWLERFMEDLKKAGHTNIELRRRDSPSYRGLYPHDYHSYEDEFDVVIDKFGLDIGSGQLGQALWCKVAKADNYSLRLTDFDIPKPLV